MKNKTIRINDIIKKSYYLMHLYGYNGTSVKKITDAADIPKGSFYNYFDNKEDYAKKVIEYLLENDTRFNIFSDKKIKPLKRIERFFEYNITKLHQKEYKYGCFVGNLTQEMADVNETLSITTEKFHTFVADKIEKCLIEAQTNGKLQETVKLETLSNYIINAWQGSLLRMKSQQNDQPLKDFMKVLKQLLI